MHTHKCSEGRTKNNWFVEIANQAVEEAGPRYLIGNVIASSTIRLVSLSQSFFFLPSEHLCVNKTPMNFQEHVFISANYRLSFLSRHFSLML